MHPREVEVNAAGCDPTVEFNEQVERGAVDIHAGLQAQHECSKFVRRAQPSFEMGQDAFRVGEE